MKLLQEVIKNWEVGSKISNDSNGGRLLGPIYFVRDQVFVEVYSERYQQDYHGNCLLNITNSGRKHDVDNQVIRIESSKSFEDFFDFSKTYFADGRVPLKISNIIPFENDVLLICERQDGSYAMRMSELQYITRLNS